MNQINKKHFSHRHKGRALSMLVASREISKINRKQKREYTPCEASKNEVKEYQNKRSKPIDYERTYDKDGRKWSKRVRRKIEKTLNDKDWDKMNVDRTK